MTLTKKMESQENLIFYSISDTKKYYQYQVYLRRLLVAKVVKSGQNT